MRPPIEPTYDFAAFLLLILSSQAAPHHQPSLWSVVHPLACYKSTFSWWLYPWRPRPSARISSILLPIPPE
uniref:Putative secreted protein n=1 Tax=Anopheles marajoara TaxID=58244 RepID=A0A2M4CE44_9DIPT